MKDIYSLYRGMLKHLFVLLFAGLLSSPSLLSQPGGGPYGPVRQVWPVPQDAGRIIYVSPGGDGASEGALPGYPTTIEKAIESAVSGDIIVLRGGVYRTGDLILNQGITMQPYLDEMPVMKGTRVADKWTDLGNGLWTTHWDLLFPSAPADWWQRNRSGKQTPLHRFNDDMVFIDGRFLQSAAYEGEVDEDSFYIDYSTGTVYIGSDPEGHTIELTAHNVCLHRITGECHGKVSDRKGPVIKGIIFTQYAYRAIEVDGKDPEGISDQKDHGKDVTGTTIEHCEISFCSRVAAYLRGDNLTIRNCRISDTSTEGIYVLSSSDVLLERNIFMRNNIEQISGYYPAAVKIFNQCHRVTCNDNLVMDLPFSNGIWYDVGNVDGVFTNNWVEGVGNTGREISYIQTWPGESGFFFEISRGALCKGNVFVNCELGIHILNSCNVLIYNNTFINSTACIARSERSAAGDHFGWHPATGPDVGEREGHVFVNNIMSGDAAFNRPLLYLWQRRLLCGRLTEPQTKEIDHNVFLDDNDNRTIPVILWSPAANDSCITGFNSPSEINRVFPEFMKEGAIYNHMTVFRSRELKNFVLLPGFRGLRYAAPVLIETGTAVVRNKKVKPYIGAYPLQN